MEKTLDFFDGDCSFGRRSIVNPGSFYKLEDLIEQMKFYGIGRALVYHAMAREYQPVMGNDLLGQEIARHSELVPVWVVMPHHTGEFPAPDQLRHQLRSNNVRAVRMFPGNSDHAYSIESWNSGELLAMLEASRIVLLIGLDQLNWNELHTLCASFPELRVILSGAGYGSDRNLYPLLRKFPNLHIETIGYKTHSGIEEICRIFGAHRLIFGSAMPLYSGGSAVSMINYARISDEEKQLIAAKNLERLLALD
ncbi:MAG TPA: hypothetical protein DD640_09755 [Clostridiales bacterium]|nr:hypothetical protein [Clostridiales bacterium]